MIFLWIALCVLAAGFGAGCEMGFTRASRIRLEGLEAGGSLPARRVRQLMADPAGLLATLLVVQNGAHAIASHLFERAVGSAWVTAVILGPALFLCAEMLPKEIFARRPTAGLMRCARGVQLARWLCIPVVAPLRLLADSLSRGRRSDSAAGSALLDVVGAGAREGILDQGVGVLAETAFDRVQRHLGHVAQPLPWLPVLGLDRGSWQETLMERRRRHPRSALRRWGLVGQRGRVEGVVDLRAALTDSSLGPVPPMVLEHDATVEEALAKMVREGEDFAVVARGAGTTLGWVDRESLLIGLV